MRDDMIAHYYKGQDQACRSYAELLQLQLAPHFHMLHSSLHCQSCFQLLEIQIQIRSKPSLTHLQVHLVK